MAPSHTQPLYRFFSQAPGVKRDGFVVISFSGQEAMSRPYRFEVTLAADQSTDLKQVMNHPAQFVIQRQEDVTTDFHGILTDLVESQKIGDYIMFKVKLVARIHLLSMTERIRLFEKKTLPELFKAELADIGLRENQDFEFRLQGHYPPYEFVTQYWENNFDFITRWMEREGVYFYFEQTTDRERIIFTDTLVAHSALSPNHQFRYVPTGSPHADAKDHIRKFKRRVHRTPGEIFIKDYNYLKPNLTVEGRAKLPNRIPYYQQLFGYQFDTPEEGNRLAQNQAEAQNCLATRYQGVSQIPYLKPGYTFYLDGHYREECNKKYLLLEVSHSGHQEGYYSSRLEFSLPHPTQKFEYQNEFTAIDAAVQFRMEFTTRKPRLPGVIHGFIDSEEQGEYAELDKFGRYKVRLPFHLDATREGQGPPTAYLRMQQPYGGQSEGMHFPLRKGTEVSLICTAGDLDRMEISGALPNPLTPSPVSSANPTESVIKTSRGNLMVMDDRKNAEGIVLSTRNHDTCIRLGAKKAGQYSFRDARRSSEGKQTQVAPKTETVSLEGYTEGEKNDHIGGDLFIRVGGNACETVGIPNIKESSPVMKEPDVTSFKKTIVNGHYETVVAGKSTEQAGIDSNNKIFEFKDGITKGTYVHGSHHLYATKDLKISAQNDTSNITMDKHGLSIDAGHDKDIVFVGHNEGTKCLGSKTSTVIGESHKEVKGKNESTCYGEKLSGLVGGEVETSAKEIDNFFFGTNITTSWNPSFKFDLGSIYFSIGLGLLKLTINPALSFSRSPSLDISGKIIKIESFIVDQQNKKKAKSNDLTNIKEEENDKDEDENEAEDLIDGVDQIVKDDSDKDIDEADQEIKTADEQLEQANKDIDEANTNEENAKENLAKADDAVTNAEEELTKANDEVTNADDALTKEDDAVAKADKELTKANNEVTNAEGELTKANDGVTKAEGELAKANDEVTNAEENLSQAEKDGNEKQIEEAKENLTKVKEKQERAKDDVTKAKENQERAKDGATEAKERQERAKDNITKAKERQKKAQDDYIDAKEEEEQAQDNVTKAKENQKEKKIEHTKAKTKREEAQAKKEEAEANKQEAEAKKEKLKAQKKGAKARKEIEKAKEKEKEAKKTMEKNQRKNEEKIKSSKEQENQAKKEFEDAGDDQIKQEEAKKKITKAEEEQRKANEKIQKAEEDYKKVKNDTDEEIRKAKEQTEKAQEDQKAAEKDIKRAKNKQAKAKIKFKNAGKPYYEEEVEGEDDEEEN